MERTHGANPMKESELKECPDSPNCVSTQTQQGNKKMDPIPFKLDPRELMKVIKDVVESHPRTELLSESSHYLHYTFKSKIFGFTDDVEFLIDPKHKLIHFRSASRTGYSDMGVNKERMTELGTEIKNALKSRAAQ